MKTYIEKFIKFVRRDSMFKLFKKKCEVLEIYAPITGECLEISQASDPVFKEKLMGEGFFVLPENREIWAPIDGIIEMIFPTKHALIIKSVNGVSMLIHIGSDTVELEGIPFNVKITEGKKGDILVNVDFNYIKEKGKGIEVYCLFPELSQTLRVTHNNVKFVTKQTVIATIC